MSTGESIRLQRLFDGGQNIVIVAIDHGLYNGPRPGFENLAPIVDRLSGADGILLSPGMVAHVQSVFEHRSAPALILRLNWGTQYATQWGYSESRSVPMISVQQAVSLGADIVLVGMSIKTGSEAVDAEKREVGVPIIGEVYPAGHEDIAPEKRHEQISIGCRIAAELGADMVKTFHTGERFAEIVRSTPVPILALGSRKAPREVDALELAAAAIRDGARGVVFGRNVIQARSPERFLEALQEVVKNGADPAAAAEKHNLA